MPAASYSLPAFPFASTGVPAANSRRIAHEVIAPSVGLVGAEVQVTRFDYYGTQRIGRSLSVATSLTGGETPALTSEIYDMQGRLWRVQEPSGTGGASVNTDYGYDSADRLISVQLKARGHTRSARIRPRIHRMMRPSG